MVTTVITAMAAYSNERVAAIILSVLYRMLTFMTRDDFLKLQELQRNSGLSLMIYIKEKEEEKEKIYIAYNTDMFKL